MINKKTLVIATRKSKLALCQTNLVKVILAANYDFNFVVKTFVTSGDKIQDQALSEIGGHIYSVELNYGKKKIITPDLDPAKMKINIGKTN